MASEVGSKSASTGACDCFRHWKPKKDKVNDLAKSTPLPSTKEGRKFTHKEVQDFAKLVKADEIDQKRVDQNADESLSSEEVKTVEVVYSKIHGVKEKKNE